MATKAKVYKTARIIQRHHSRIKQDAARFGITMDDALEVVIERGLKSKKGAK